MWLDHDFSGAGWLAMAFAMTALWIVIAVLMVAVVRSSREPRGERLDPREILARRLAGGEIGLDEYQERLDALGRPRG